MQCWHVWQAQHTGLGMGLAKLPAMPRPKLNLPPPSTHQHCSGEKEEAGRALAQAKLDAKRALASAAVASKSAQVRAGLGRPVLAARSSLLRLCRCCVCYGS